MGSILDVKSTGLGKLRSSVRRNITRRKKPLVKINLAKRRKNKVQDTRRKESLKRSSDKSIAKHPYIQKPVKRSIDRKALHKGFKLTNIKNAEGKKPRYNKWGDRIS